jgi:hypothetical protein
MRHQVVYVMSTNFAGSTVLGLVVGSHRNGMFLGEPSMIVRCDGLGRWMHNKFCAICGDDWHNRCPVWKPVLVAQVRESQERVYDLLAAESRQARFFVDASKNLEWLDVGIRSGRVDAAVVHISKGVQRYAASVLTRPKHPRLIESIGLGWARANKEIRSHAARNGLRYLHIRYEEFVNNCHEVLNQLGAFIGFEPEPAQIEFWSHSHHYIKGNPGTLSHFDPSRIATQPGLNRELYRQNHRTIFLDDKWKDLLSFRDLNRLLSLPEVEEEMHVLEHEVPSHVRPSTLMRWRSRIVAKAIDDARGIRSMYAVASSGKSPAAPPASPVAMPIVTAFKDAAEIPTEQPAQ